MKKVGILFVLLSALSFSAASAKSSKTASAQTVVGRFNQLEADPVLICPAFVATAISAIVSSSVSPDL